MEKRCIECGALIPEESVLCLRCASENDMQRFYDEQERQREELKNAVRLTAQAVDELSASIIRAETTPCIQFGGKMITIAEAIKILRNGNGGTVMKWRKCADAQPKTPRNALVLVGTKYRIAYWDGYKWDIDGWEIDVQPDYWQNLPLLPAEMMQNGEQ